MSDLVKHEKIASPTIYRGQREDWSARFIDEDGGDLVRYFQVLLRRKWLIVASVLIVLATVAIGTFSTTPLYKSTVKIHIDPEDNVLPYQKLYESAVGNPQYIQTQIEVLESRNLAGRVVESLHLAEDPSKVKSETNSILSNLEVVQIPTTQIVLVSYVSPDPELTAKVANKLAEEYVNYSFEGKYQATTKARDFLQKELLDLKKKVERSEEGVLKYALEKNEVLLLSDKDNVVHRKLADLSQQMTAVEAQLLSNRYQDIKGATVENFPESAKSNAMRELERQLSTLNQRLASLSSQFGPKWPEVKTVNEEIANLRRQLAGETQKAIEQSGMEYNLLREHRRRLASAIEAQTHLFNQFSEDSIQYNILKRDLDTDRQLYAGLLERLKQAEVSTGLKSANIRVIDKAEVPSSPYDPNVLFNMSLGLGVGLLSGIMLAFFSEYMDKTFSRPEEVEQALGLPSLGIIPSLGESRNGVASGLLANKTSDCPQTGLVPYTQVLPLRCWESYRSLRTSLLLSSPEKPPQTVLVTSPLPGEGKTTTSVNLAISFAQTGARTLILELDMRRPMLFEVFRVGRNQGMSQYLSGNCELSTQVQETGIPNLFVVQGGPIPPNPPELIGSRRMRLALQLFSRHFSYIVIDSPPLLSVTDAVVVSPQVDGVLLVIRGKETPKDAARKARNHLASVGARILGTLVNDVDVDESRYGYYDYQR